MATILRITEAASLALHATVYIAAHGESPVSTGRLAKALNASAAHLSKVMQRLTHVGLLKSLRGPRGGFVLTRPAKEITLLEVYEAIEGPFGSSVCLFDSHVCSGTVCVLAGLLKDVHGQVKKYLKSTTLDKPAHVFE